MFLRKFIPATAKAISLAFLMFTASSCDLVNPALAPAFSGNIEFQASSSEITLGEGATLTWAISDPDGALTNAKLYGGGLADIVSLTGSKGVAPTQSTIYFLDALDSDGQAVRSAQVKIRVVGDDGQEIVSSESPTSETSCDDGKDNDGDELVDCDDSDCEEFEACVEKAAQMGTFTVAPTYTVHAQKDGLVCPGDTVTIAWESTYDSIHLNDRSTTTSTQFSDADALSGSYNFPISDFEKTIVVELVGISSLQEDAVYEVSFRTNSEDDCIDPTFQGSLSVTVFPSKNLVLNEPYRMTWTSSDLSALTLNGDPVSIFTSDNSSEYEFFATQSNVTHSFGLTDDQNPAMTDSQTVKIYADGFSGFTTAPELESGVSGVVTTYDKSMVYVMSGAKAVKASNYFTQFEVMVDGSGFEWEPPLQDPEADPSYYIQWHNDYGVPAGVRGYAEDSAGKKYVISEKFIYVHGEEGLQVMHLTLQDNLEFNFVYVTPQDNVIVGTSNGLLSFNTTGSCDPKPAGYCCNQINSETGYAIASCDQNLGGSQYNKIFRSPSTNELFLIKGTGLYSSSNGGRSFSSIYSQTGLKGGVSLARTNGFVWTDSQVYQFDEDNNFEAISGITNSMTGGQIHSVTEFGGRIFLATDNGVFVHNDLGWAQNPSTTAKVFHFSTSQSGDSDLALVGQGLKIGILSDAGQTSFATFGKNLEFVATQPTAQPDFWLGF